MFPFRDSFLCLSSGGNEESELCELQTAREWSDDEDGEGPDEDDGLASSPSVWGTPRQNSFEQTFSYIAIAEASGAARQHRDRRGRAGSRGSRASVIHTDTLDTLLDPPDVEWDPNAFLAREEEGAGAPGDAEASGGSAEEASGEYGDMETVTIQPPPLSLDPDRRRDVGSQPEEPEDGKAVQPPPPSPPPQHRSPPLTPQGESVPDVTPSPTSLKPVSSQTESAMTSL